MKELNQQEVALVSGAHYGGGSIFDALGNVSEAVGTAGETVGNALTGGLFAPLGSAAYSLGETLTTALVNVGNSLIGGQQY